MSEITEKQRVVGTLLTQGQEYWMLELFPRVGRDLPLLLRENSFQFYVVVDGYAQNIVVSRGSFAIIPIMSDHFIDVQFIVEGEDKSEDIISQDRFDALKYSELFLTKNPI